MQTKVNRRSPLLDRFMAKVSPEALTGCWLWTGSIKPEGYGQCCTSNGRRDGAHRVALWLLRGIEIPAGSHMHVDHKCRNKACVNPDHLELVSAKENRHRSMPFEPPRKTVCHRGHPYSAENTFVRSDGGRVCRPCHRIRNKAYEARKKGRVPMAA